jgi:hypothetical protein
MKLFVILTFDIKDGQPKDYTSFTTWLGGIHLQRTIWQERKNPIELPHNTYAGTWPHAANAEAALEHVRNTLQLISGSESLWGRAFICVSGDEMAYQGVTFAGGKVQIM